MQEQPRGPRPPKTVLHAEESKCSRGGNHVLTNKQAKTYCSKCNRSWAAIDATLNRAFRKRKVSAPVTRGPKPPDTKRKAA